MDWPDHIRVVRIAAGSRFSPLLPDVKSDGIELLFLGQIPLLEQFLLLIIL